MQTHTGEARSHMLAISALVGRRCRRGDKADSGGELKLVRLRKGPQALLTSLLVHRSQCKGSEGRAGPWQMSASPSIAGAPTATLQTLCQGGQSVL